MKQRSSAAGTAEIAVGAVGAPSSMASVPSAVMFLVSAQRPELDERGESVHGDARR
jgi:hypothetical protein